jgi:hypothetical protein
MSGKVLDRFRLDGKVTVVAKRGNGAAAANRCGDVARSTLDHPPFQAGFPQEIIRLAVEVVVGGRKDADLRNHCGAIALVSRSVNLRAETLRLKMLFVHAQRG